jgi:hypothetical protein
MVHVSYDERGQSRGHVEGADGTLIAELSAVVPQDDLGARCSVDLLKDQDLLPSEMFDLAVAFARVGENAEMLNERFFGMNMR